MQAFAPEQNRPRQRPSLGPARPGVQAEQRLLRADNESSGTRSGTTATSRLGHDLGRISIYPKAMAKDQPTLTVNTPGDAYEQEADRVADQVMRVSAPPVQGAVSPTGQRALLRQVMRPRDLVDSVAPPEEEGEEESPSPEPQQALQRSSTGGTMTTTASFEKSLERSIRSEGEALPQGTRTFMESRFGRDFAGVRIHRDAKADEFAHGVNARAFTVGNSIFFARSAYQPESVDGQRLIAHELTHVLQQGASERAIPGPIQRQVAGGHPCPRYNGYNTSVDIGTYNCAGLALRNYQYLSPSSAVVASLVSDFPLGQSIACGTPGGPNRIKFWLWQYDLSFEDDQGVQLRPPSPDFHIAAGLSDPLGLDPTDVYSKNGARPVEGPGTGPGFRPAARARTLTNDASAQPVNAPNGRPVFSVRTNFTESCFRASCPP
jgi:hypothetical protein